MIPKRSFTLDGRVVGPETPPYVVAEMSGNHNGSIDRAFAILAAAKEAGCNAVKLQTYKPDTITLDVDAPGFTVEEGLWGKQRLFDLYRHAQTPWEWHQALFDRAHELGLTIFSSPFDPTAVDLLESLDCPAYKIASFEIVDLPLIACCAATGKPIMMSVGMATIDEIYDAVTCARSAGARDIALLYCVSAYPAPASDMNLRTLHDLAQRFDVVVGLSDHTLGIGAAVASVALGASVIEKHFTLARSDGGSDAAFSIEPAEMAALCEEARTAWQAIGEVTYGPKDSDGQNAKYRRSLYVVADISEGEELTADNVRSVRPGFGLPPKHLDAILGRRAAKAISKGTPLAWDLLESKT